MATLPRRLSPSTSHLERDARWLLVERILATPSFVRSGRLSSFLEYICLRHLTGQAGLLNEQSIGEAVFERAPGYDPGDDNIVRSHASRLRARLEAYFQNEGASEPIRLTVPKGSYVPVFARAAMEPTIVALPTLAEDAPAMATPREEPANIATPVPRTQRPSRIPSRHLPRILWLALAVALLTMAAIALRQRAVGVARAIPQTPIHRLWSQMFTRDRNTLIVPADSSLVIARRIAGSPVDLAQYASGRYRAEMHCTKPCDKQLLREVQSLRYTSMADLQFAVALSRLPEALPDRTQVRYARDLQLEDLKQANVILAGSKEADPWMNVIERQMNFVVHDDAAGPLYVEDRNPLATEKKQYPFLDDDLQHRGLATIAFLPNLSGKGSLLVVQGFTYAGTQAAAEFLTGGQDFDKLFHPIVPGSAPIPHFEILLQTMDVNGIAGPAHVIAWRTYP